MSHEDDVLEQQALIAELQYVSLISLTHLRTNGKRAFDSLGLTYGQAMVLIFTERGESATTELSTRLGIVRPGLSALITHLAQAGFLERQFDHFDARRVTIQLTDKGIEACSRIRQAWDENFPVDLQRLSNDDLRQLVEAVRLVTKYDLS